MQMEKTPGEDIVVILSSADQKAFGVTYNALSFSDRRTRRFCEQLAVLICLQEGVPASGDISIRAAENAGGELLLYFSVPRPRESETYAGAVVLDSLDALLDCRKAFPPLHGTVEVYGLSSQYYLWISSKMPTDPLFSALAEYGTLSTVDRSFLTEHGQLLPAASSLFAKKP